MSDVNLAAAVAEIRSRHLDWILFRWAIRIPDAQTRLRRWRIACVLLKARDL